MKLNPAKCTFVVEEGQFLGYYVTKEWIKPSLSNIEELKGVSTPHTLRDDQGLNGKLITLSHFISKLAEKAMPLFNKLKVCIEKRNFRWTPKAEAALH